MRPINTTQTLLAAVAFSIFGCATRPAYPPQTPSPEPRPEETPTKNVESRPKAISAWSFRYSPKTYSYTITTTPEIAQFPDTSNYRVLPSASENVVIAVTDTGTEVISPPPQESFKCDEANALLVRAKELLPQIPTNLEAGFTWTDSTVTDGCRGSIPTVSTVVRVYEVIGDTTYDTLTALLIRKTETIVAKGEGHEGQHRVLMTATGSGTASLYFDVLAGSYLGMSGVQTTELTITASGRVSKFLQRITQIVRMTQ